ncbi:PaaX family transcriptional regulator [Arthrobacter rhombi]|uniref:PaaX family transcriptional regulator n=1 Tax=Arthrobacter rhombi TaxID=71253 RepID=UPI003F902CE0
MSAVLDDMDSRPGSTTSLLRTIIGLYLRGAGGWMSSAQLLTLMEAVDVSPALTRTALTRLRRKGVLDAATRDGVSGYAVGERARQMLERGDRRIHEPRAMNVDDPWCLISFTVPETDRGLRHQLRRRLYWIGCGTVGPGLWICPQYLQAETEEILQDLGLRERAVLFETKRPQTAGPLGEAVADWWDLDELAGLHREFLGQQRDVPELPPSEGSSAFATYLHCIDSWRIIPYRDPGLPQDCLPEDWPGTASSARFLQLRNAYRPVALAYVQSITTIPAHA